MADFEKIRVVPSPSGRGKIGEVRPKPSLFCCDRARTFIKRDEMTKNSKNDEENAVIQREDSEQTAHVKGDQRLRTCFGIRQDPSDQHAGKDEKELDSVHSRR